MKERAYRVIIIDYSDENQLLEESTPKCSWKEFQEYCDRNDLWGILDWDLCKPCYFGMKKLDGSLCIYKHIPQLVITGCPDERQLLEESVPNRPYRVIIDFSGESQLLKKLDLRQIPECSLEEHEKYCFGNVTFAHLCASHDLPFPQRVLIRKPDGTICWCICGGPREQTESIESAE